MQHVFSAQLGVSLKFSSKLEDIADKIFQKKGIRTFFGNQPILTPDKKAFFLNASEKNNLSLVYLQMPPIPQPTGNNAVFPNGIILTMQNEMSSDLNLYNDLKDLFVFCIDIIKAELDVSVEKIGSVFTEFRKMDDPSKFLDSGIVQPFLKDDTFFGGNFRFVYRHQSVTSHTPFNISIAFNMDDPPTLIIVSDINSQPSDNISDDELLEILDYAKTFMTGIYLTDTVNRIR